MNKILKSTIFTSLLLIGVTTACNLSVSQPEPTQTVNPTETAKPTATFTPAVPPASPTPEFAPFCEAGSASVLPPSQCQVPVAEESSIFCKDKNPYNLILLDRGLTYEVLTKGFRCTDAGIKNDKQMIACTGQIMASTYEINVCDPACVVPTVQAAVTKCPQDYHYNDVQGCCTQEIQQASQNCAVQKFRTTVCVMNCSGIIRKSNCLKNSSACVWNDEQKVCELRK